MVCAAEYLSATPFLGPPPVVVSTELFATGGGRQPVGRRRARPHAGAPRGIAGPRGVPADAARRSACHAGSCAGGASAAPVELWHVLSARRRAHLRRRAGAGGRRGADAARCARRDPRGSRGEICAEERGSTAVSQRDRGHRGPARHPAGRPWPHFRAVPTPAGRARAARHEDQAGLAQLAAAAGGRRRRRRVALLGLQPRQRARRPLCGPRRGRVNGPRRGAARRDRRAV